MYPKVSSPLRRGRAETGAGGSGGTTCGGTTCGDGTVSNIRLDDYGVISRERRVHIFILRRIVVSTLVEKGH